jgi:mannose-6-phosphate isomerase-like protein (cupin superfamily)
MFIKDFNECKEIISGDNCILREILHPVNDNIEINYSLAHAIVKPGEITLKHKLKNSEVYYILQGEGIMYIDDESKHVREKHAIYIPPHSLQHIENTGKEDLIFICIVEPPWMAEDEEIEGEKYGASN